MAERQSQFCYSFVSQDSEKVLGRNTDSAEAVFLWLLKPRHSVFTQINSIPSESKQSRKRRRIFNLKNSHGIRRAGDGVAYS